MNAAVPNDDLGPVVFINTFTVKPGKLDDFIAIMMSAFDTIGDHKRVHETSRFAEHVQKVRPLIESAGPGYYQVVHEVGQF
jgi:hypothetical protein